MNDMFWNAKNGKVPLGNTAMSYVSFGYGDRTLILLPGLSDGLVTVRGKALLLAKPYSLFFEKYTVYMFSRKDSMPDHYSIRDMAKDLCDAMNALGIRKASVMGVSQGGMIAQFLAIDYSYMVDRLILAVTAPCANDIIENNVKKWMNLAQHCAHRELMIDTAEQSYSENYLKKYRKTYPFIGLIGKPSSYRRFLINAEAILEFDASKELNKITCPTLIIGGEKDRTVGIQASYELKKSIHNSVLYTYEEYGHAAYEEAADFNSRVFKFLEETPL